MGSVPQISGYLRNMRYYVGQRFSPRGGMVVISATPFDQLLIHSVRRLNDATSASFKRVYGSGTKLYLGEGMAAIDSGYSGNPLALLPFRPDQSPQPWMYVADSLRMRKVRVDGLLHTVGIEPPLLAPNVNFGPDAFQAISSFSAVGGWAPGGTAGAISSVVRLNTTITKILYDSGTTGFACVQPAAFSDQIQKGMLILVNSAETILVNDVYQPFPATTIASIVYDSGSTGLCTIQPAVATVAGANKPPSAPIATPIRVKVPRAIIQKTGKLPTTPSIGSHPIRVFPGPIGTRLQTTLAVGLQPNALLRLNSGGGNDEYVRVISVSAGPNGISSFRCSTVNTHAAAETITGVGSFRAFFVNTHANGETITDNVFQSTVTAGQGFISLTSAFNMSVAAGLPIQEDDTIHISFKFDHPEFMTEAKIFFDVDSTTNDFAHNFFYHTIRQSDMQQAVLSNQTAQAARQAAITKQFMQVFQRNPGILNNKLGPNSLGNSSELGIPDPSIGNVPFQSGGAVVNSGQASTGASQWSEFAFKVSDLTRVGADKSRGLGNVAAIRIQWTVSSSTVCNVGDLWVGGAYGPDIGTTGSPLFYRTRGRSTLTGAKSLAGPPTRLGIEPHRQRVIVSGNIHPNASANVIDVFRWGSTLLNWIYVGSTPNAANWQFSDDFSDTEIGVNPQLDFDAFQPFPTVDLPRSGVCNVVGTKVTRVSGDTFNPQWYPGAQININGIYYTLYAQPPGDGTLEIIENAGTQPNVPFFLNQATILGQPLPSFWGPYAEGTAAFGFACGDSFQPGVLFLTNGNDMDSASDTLQLEVSSPSEPLMNGCIYDATPFVWSSDRFYRLTPNLGSTVTSPTLLDPSATQLFIPYPVAGGKGLLAQWGFCVGDAMYYRSKDGIEASAGSSSQSITDQDLYLLFGHDGQPGQPVTIGTVTFFPPDDTKLSQQRLSFVDGHVYFDYVDTNGVQRTMVYNTLANVWGVDDYTPQVLTHYADEGKGVHQMILGGNDGRVYTSSGSVDGTGLAFPCEARMPQLSELSGGYNSAYDGFLGLQGSQSGQISLVVNVDGVDNLVSVPVGTSYARPYIKFNPFKGKILAFGLVSAFPFSLFERDVQFRIGSWGRAEESTPTNPFSSLRRAAQPKVG